MAAVHGPGGAVASDPGRVLADRPDRPAARCRGAPELRHARIDAGPDQECVPSLPPHRDADRPPAVTAPAVELEGITKRFPGVVANKDIDLHRSAAGTVHAIVGENGAGKSTLMKILYGVQRPDEGTIEVDGDGRRPALARPTPSPPGIGMVFQHFMLADNLTVLENVVLGAEKLHGIGDDGRARRSARSPTPTGSTSTPTRSSTTSASATASASRSSRSSTAAPRSSSSTSRPPSSCRRRSTSSSTTCAS